VVPADGSTETAGACASPSGPIVSIEANPDTPAPRCVAVTSGQELRVVNTSANFSPFAGLPVIVTFADYPQRTVPIGGSTLFTRPLGAYLAPGDHFIHFSAAAGTPCPADISAFCFDNGYTGEIFLR
jgi:hypothetical protein